MAIFEIARSDGPIVPDELKRYFSARRNLIEERLGEYQVASRDAPELAAAITRGTRSAKMDDIGDRFDRWKSIAMARGLDLTRLALAEIHRELMTAATR